MLREIQESHEGHSENSLCIGSRSHLVSYSLQLELFEIGF